jgi:hypothetical protein
VRFLRTSEITSAILLALTLGTAGVARAHGGRPQTQAILWDASGERIVVPATFGLLVSDDGGASFEWTCQESIPDAVTGTTSPAVLVPGDRLVLAGVYGLLRGERAGCAWTYDDALRDHYAADVVRTSDGRVLAVSGDSGAENRIFESTDDGLSFVATGAPLRARFLPERLRIAPSDEDTMYVVGQAFVEGTTDVVGVVMRSEDGGASWTETSLGALEEGERLVRALGVDPADPRVLYAVAMGSEHDRMLRSEDGGGTWALVSRLEAAPMPYGRPFAFEVAPDGSAYFGNTREGLFVRRPDGVVALVDKYVALACLAARGTSMWMCGDGIDDGFALARFETGVPYVPEVVLQLAHVRERACDTDVDCRCAPWWNDFLTEVMRTTELRDGGPVCAIDAGATEPDAGVESADAGAAMDGGTTPSDPPPVGCGCGLAARSSGTAALALAPLVLLARRARRRSA